MYIKKKKYENKMFNSDEMDKFLEKLNLPKLTQEKKRGKLNRSIAIKLNFRGKKYLEQKN